MLWATHVSTMLSNGIELILSLWTWRWTNYVQTHWMRWLPKRWDLCKEILAFTVNNVKYCHILMQLNKKCNRRTFQCTIFLCELQTKHNFCLLGGIHKLRHPLRGAEWFDEMWHYVTRDERDPKFCDITFQIVLSPWTQDVYIILI